MITFKIYKDAILRKSKHVYRHDEIILRTIRAMRKMGMTMTYYDESIMDQCPTIMKFEKKEDQCQLFMK